MNKKVAVVGLAALAMVLAPALVVAAQGSGARTRIVVPVDGQDIQPSSATSPLGKFDVVDAGVLHVANEASTNGSFGWWGGASSSSNGTYGLFICSSGYARVGAGCAGGTSTPLDFYSGAGNKQWSIDGSGHIVPAGATQKIQATNNSGGCTLNGGSPATCTVTVTAGARCFCSLVGTTAAIAAMNCAVNLSGTTLTVTAANAANANVIVICDK
jgi:hypothetical protein